MLLNNPLPESCEPFLSETEAAALTDAITVDGHSEHDRLNSSSLLAPSKAPFVIEVPDDEPDIWESMKLALPAVKTSLVQRFESIAPKTAVAAHAEYVHSNLYDERLVEEIRQQIKQGSLPDAATSPEYIIAAGFWHEYLMGLNDRKEIDLGGMVANNRVPAGFVRGRGSMQGNNCFISSVMQALVGKELRGPEHDEACAQIRRAGLGQLWRANNFIEAIPSTLSFVTRHVFGEDRSVMCHLYSSRDGTTLEDVACGECSAGEGPQHHIHMFNPTGVHFDPLWKRQ
jgi:hypothetical protein